MLLVEFLIICAGWMVVSEFSILNYSKYGSTVSLGACTVIIHQTLKNILDNCSAEIYQTK